MRPHHGMNFPAQAVVFCGGRGERLRPLTDNLPKPMASVRGRPFLEYLVEQLRDAGVDRILLLTGYLGEQISSHFGDGSRWNVKIAYHRGAAEWETGQRLAEAAALLERRFFLLYADNLAPVSFPWLVQCHNMAQKPLTVTLSRKAAGNIRLSASGLVAFYDSTRTQPGLDFVEIGYMIAERDAILLQTPVRGSFSLVLRNLALSGQLAAFNPGCFYQSISDLDRLRLVEEYVTPKKLLLVDRDGLINRKASRGEYIWRREDFIWLEENIAGLEELARHGFEFIIITNQAGVARRMFTMKDVTELHVWMTTRLKERGIVVRDIFICPHHWTDGCACRKPLPGMLFAAAKKHQLRLENTFYIGDDERDVLASWRAGCPCVMISIEQLKLSQAGPHVRCQHLTEAVPGILDAFRTCQLNGTKST
jgi:histidinol-phosphate phosphatase family protein